MYSNEFKRLQSTSSSSARPWQLYTYGMKAVWWIKRDFRLSDNSSLSQALNECSEILPFYCFEKNKLEEEDFSLFHLQAQTQALSGLLKNLRMRHSGIFFGVGEVIEELRKLRKKYHFEKLYSHQETGNLLSFEVDRQVAKWCKHEGVTWSEAKGSSVVRGGNAERRRKTTRSDIRIHPPLSIPEVIPSPKNINLFNQIPSFGEVSKFVRPKDQPLLDKEIQQVDEASALQTLESFLSHRGYGYSGGISSPNSAFEAGSRLSTHLAWGTIGLRTVFAEVRRKREELDATPESKQWRRSLRAFESRLHWRDHFIQRLEGFPEMENLALNKAYRNLEYENSPELLEAWWKGQTGVPMVDACMRCLNETGFLNFRMRAMVVSFACFGLKLSWKLIHPPLAKVFLDYEPGIHMSQIQMQAGIVGFNTIRVYNPYKQIKDHDPSGVFVKKWVPEIKEWTMKQILELEAIPQKSYSPVSFDAKMNSKTMKDRIFAIRKSKFGKLETNRNLNKHGSKKGKFKKPKKDHDNGQLTLF